VPADVVTAARRLASPAGQQLADWLTAGGPTDPVTEIVTVPVPPPDRPWQRRPDDAPTEHLVARLLPNNATYDPVVDSMLEYDPTGSGRKFTHSQKLWPVVLPSHREVVAANLLPHLADGPTTICGNLAASALPALADCSGPCDDAVALALAYTLGSTRSEERVAALDAALTLNSTGDLDGARVGGFLRTLLTCRNVKLTRVTLALTDLADAGATAATWPAVSALLAAVLPTPKPPPGTPDLLALASRVAAAQAARGTVTGLAEVAARTGTSRLATEARRLARVLGG
jgi:hypothetical protein